MNSIPSDASTPLRRLQPYRVPASATGNQPLARSRWSDTPTSEIEVPADIQAKIEALRHAQASASTHTPLPPTPPNATPDDQSRISLADDRPDQRDRGELPPSPSGNALIKQLSVFQLLSEPRIETRAKMDESTIAEYAEAMSHGAQFPPVVVFDEEVKFWLADGCHRVEASSRAGLETIKAEVRKGGKLDAVRYALRANVRHGLRRTNADKRLSVKLALQEFVDDSDRAIAELCGVGNALVGEVRQQVFDSNTSTVRTGRDGKHYPGVKRKCTKRLAEPVIEDPQTQAPDPAPQQSSPVPAPQEASEQEGVVVSDASSVGVDQLQEAVTRSPETPKTDRESEFLPSSLSEPVPSVPDVTPPTQHADVTVPPLVSSPVFDGEGSAANGADLIPADKVQRAADKVRVRELVSSAGLDLSPEVRRMVLLLAALLNRHAGEFPRLEGREFCLLASTANAKLQAVMDWL